MDLSSSVHIVCPKPSRTPTGNRTKLFNPFYEMRVADRQKNPFKTTTFKANFEVYLNLAIFSHNN